MDAPRICFAAAVVLIITAIAYRAWRRYRQQEKYTYATAAPVAVTEAGRELADALSTIAEVGHTAPESATESARHSAGAVAKLALPVVDRLRNGPSTYAKYHAVYANLSGGNYSSLGQTYVSIGDGSAEGKWLAKFGKELSNLAGSVHRLGAALGLE